jgi:RNA polymerase nonessential primary-like sigma factor
VDRSDDEHTLGDFMADELALDPTGVTQNHEVERLLANWIDTLSTARRKCWKAASACTTATPRRWRC